VPVIDHWWQTETGWPIAANCLGIERLPVKPGSPTCPCRAMTSASWTTLARAVPPGFRSARMVIKLPLPPGCLPTLWNADDRFVASLPRAFPGLLQDGRRRL
jgi:propionyl-CoA synthetase